MTASTCRSGPPAPTRARSSTCNGPELANGDTLSIGDYRCRSYQAGLFCVNYAHQSAVRFASAGIEPFGCLKPAPPPDGVGVAFGC